MSIPTVPELDKCLKHLVNWQWFSLHLPGIDQSDIDRIKDINKHDDVADQKVALYEKWLRVYPDASWGDVISALETVGEISIAAELQKKWIVQQNKAVSPEKSKTMSIWCGTYAMSIPTVPELDKCLKHLVNWWRFALHLPGIDQSDINRIKDINKHDDVADQKVALYEKWLRVYPDASWGDVISALETVEENAIAAELQQKFSGIVQQNKAVSPEKSKQVNNPSQMSLSQSSLVADPYVPEEVVTKLEELQQSFVELTEDVKSKVEIEVENGNIIIKSLVNLFQLELELRAFQIKSLESVKTTDGFFKTIFPHYNFLSCYPIIRVALFLSNTGPLAEKAKKYQERIQKFKKSTVVVNLKSILNYHYRDFRVCNRNTVEITVENVWGPLSICLVEVLVQTLFPVKHPAELQWFEVIPGSHHIGDEEFKKAVSGGGGDLSHLNIMHKTPGSGKSSLKQGEPLLPEDEQNSTTIIRISLSNLLHYSSLVAGPYVPEEVVTELEELQQSFVELTEDVKSKVKIEAENGNIIKESLVNLFQLELRAFQIKSLESVTTTDGFFKTISPHYNFLSCYLIIRVALFLSNTGPLAEKAKKYQERIQKFKKSTVVANLKSILNYHYHDFRACNRNTVEITVENVWGPLSIGLVEVLVQTLFPVKHPAELQWFEVISGSHHIGDEEFKKAVSGGGGDLSHLNIMHKTLGSGKSSLKQELIEEISQLSHAGLLTQQLKEPNIVTESHGHIDTPDKQTVDVGVQFNYATPDKQTVDVGVQFNYVSHETDCLQGVTIFNSKLFTIHGGQPHSFIWEGFGFELHVPEGGDFLFPSWVVPVSAIYIISIASKLLQPSLLKIQHCVALNKVTKHSQLSFYRATLKEPTPPYHFRHAKGGKFDENSQYGQLKLPVFCAMAIGKDQSTSSDEDTTDSSGFGSDIEQKSQETSVSFSKETKNSVDSSIIFLGQVFYIEKQLNQWEMRLIVVKHLEAFAKYVKSELQGHEANITLSLRFSADNIELILDEKDIDRFKGWAVELFVEPCTIPFTHAISFGYTKEECIPPACLVAVYGDNSESGYAGRLNYPVLLEGALVGNRSEQPTLFIKRTMKMKGELQALTQQDKSPQSSDVVDIDCARVITCIKKVMTKNFAGLQEAFNNSIERVSAEMYSAGLITSEVQKRHSAEAIIKDFQSGFHFKDTWAKIEKHCNLFLGVLKELGGPLKDAGDFLKIGFRKVLKEECNIDYFIIE